MKTVKPLDCKAGSSGIERPLFSPGLLLEDEDLTAGVSYTRELSRLLFRSLFGCGVICGLEVKGELFCKRQQLRVTVGPGLALDGAGNPIQVRKSVQLWTSPDCKKLPKTVWVVICYKELGCHSREVACSPDADSQSVKTRAVDAYEIKLYEDPPACACSCGKKPRGTSVTPPPGNCCEELIEDPAPAAPAAPAAAGTTAEPDPCDCYKRHFDATSCVDCGCSCVLIATVSTVRDAKDEKDIDLNVPDDIETRVDASVRRWIRPVLTGMCKCRKPKAAAPTT
jgi:hypothetical protein